MYSMRVGAHMRARIGPPQRNCFTQDEYCALDGWTCLDIFSSPLDNMTSSWNSHIYLGQRKTAQTC